MISSHSDGYWLSSVCEEMSEIRLVDSLDLEPRCGGNGPVRYGKAELSKTTPHLGRVDTNPEVRTVNGRH